MELPRPNGQLSVEQVTFMPPGADTPALRRLTFVVNPGEILGVIGPSGAGKSTLGRLIAGTIAPTAGHVRLDSADIGIWLASGGHRYLGYLPQDIELFGGTVRENIARLQEAPADDVIAAATMVGLHETIMRLPQGYETDIGEGGMRLSGGQRQRLGLARALFGYPRLIVLDEPNASLDTEGEEALRRAIQEMRERGSTIIIIAQRLGILNMSDKILVLDNGIMNAFGNRRDVAGKIRSGRTSIPVRHPQIIAARKTTRQLGHEGERSPATTARGLSSRRNPRGRVMRGPNRTIAHDLAAILPPPPGTPFQRLRLLAASAFAVVGVFVIGFGFWATYAPLESAAIAGGAIEAESSRKTIQHLEGGIVGRILVNDGDEVAAGQPLIRLDDTRLAPPSRCSRCSSGKHRRSGGAPGGGARGRDTIRFPAALMSAAQQRTRAGGDRWPGRSRSSTPAAGSNHRGSR